MLFKKRSTSQQRRMRQPLQSEGLGTKPVFSYHARSGRTEPSGARRASKLLWVAGSGKPASPRPSQKKLPKKLLGVVITIVLTALVVNSLILSRDPMLIVSADTAGRQVLLRSEETYYQAARSVLGDSFSNTTKLSIDTKRVALALKQQFPELELVSLTLPILGHQPVIYLQPAQPALLLKPATGGAFVLDVSGRVLADVSRLPRLEKLGLAVVEDQSGLSAELGQTALPSDNVSFITEVIGQLKAKQLVVASLVLPPGASELDLKLKGKPYIVKFNLRGDARAEAGAFLAVKKHLERQRKTPGSYIDVRVENKAYYR